MADQVVIIGGGVIGSAVARWLTRPEYQAARPCQVTLRERNVI